MPGDAFGGRPALAGAIHEALEEFAGAIGLAQFAVGEDLVEGHLVETAGEIDEQLEGGELRGGGRLHLEIAQENDAEVVLVVAFDVGALIGQGAGLPDATGAIDGEVIGDVGPLVVGGAGAGVELAFDLTAHAVTGLSEVLKNLAKFRRLFAQLYRLALERKPDAIICVDFSGFNRRFAHAIRKYHRARKGWFHDWNPRIVQYVSPQVWASREGRAYQMAQDFDLLLSIFPFERDWYAARVPKLRVEFVGNPIIDRYGATPAEAKPKTAEGPQTVILLPGSRPGELARHLPVLLETLKRIRAVLPQVEARMVLPKPPSVVFPPSPPNTRDMEERAIWLRVR